MKLALYSSAVVPLIVMSVMKSLVSLATKVGYTRAVGRKTLFIPFSPVLIFVFLKS